MLLFTALACTKEVQPMDDDSLEASGVASETSTAEGPTTVARGAADGDWTLTVDGVDFDWHSGSRADLSLLDGRELAIEVLDTPPMGRAYVREDGVPVLVATVGDGSDAFGRPMWTFGDPIGKGALPVGDETDRVVFYDVVVHADGGDVVLMPGEPTAVAIDGAVWRVTVTAAYRGDAQGSRCGATDLLEVEALRTDAAVDEQPVARPTAPREAFVLCG